MKTCSSSNRFCSKTFEFLCLRSDERSLFSLCFAFLSLISNLFCCRISQEPFSVTQFFFCLISQERDPTHSYRVRNLPDFEEEDVLLHPEHVGRLQKNNKKKKNIKTKEKMSVTRDQKERDIRKGRGKERKKKGKGERKKERAREKERKQEIETESCKFFLSLSTFIARVSYLFCLILFLLSHLFVVLVVVVVVVVLFLSFFLFFFLCLLSMFVLDDVTACISGAKRMESVSRTEE